MSVTAFDLIAHPEAIQPPWAFLAFFWAAGAFIVALGVAAWRYRWKPWRRGFFALFALLWCGLVSYATVTEVGLARSARAAARDGRFLTADGCLSSFHPGLAETSKSTDANEVWTLRGERFDYGSSGVGFAWQRVEPSGGAIHADTHVNVAFVRNETYGRNEILRLIVRQHACPRAPDPGVTR